MLGMGKQLSVGDGRCFFSPVCCLIIRTVGSLWEEQTGCLPQTCLCKVLVVLRFVSGSVQSEGICAAAAPGTQAPKPVPLAPSLDD